MSRTRGTCALHLRYINNVSESSGIASGSPAWSNGLLYRSALRTCFRFMQTMDVCVYTVLESNFIQTGIMVCCCIRRVACYSHRPIFVFFEEILKSSMFVKNIIQPFLLLFLQQEIYVHTCMLSVLFNILYNMFDKLPGRHETRSPELFQMKTYWR